jgi:hypothetical protein
VWAKLDCGWYEARWIDGAKARRSELLAAWAVALAWTVQHRTDGLLPSGRAEALLAYALELDRVDAGKLAEALVEVGAWIEVASGYRIADWDQPTRDDQDRARDLASRRQARRREVSASPDMSRRDSHAMSRRDSHGMSRRDSVDVSRRDGVDLSRSQIREEQIRTEQNRSAVAHAPAPAPSPAPARETVEPEQTQTPTAGQHHGGMSDDQAAILQALTRHAKLQEVATADLAATIDGRRLARGHSVAEVCRAIDDAAAHLLEGMTAEALRRRIVQYTDRARPPVRVVAPAQSEVPIERAWKVGAL